MAQITFADGFTPDQLIPLLQEMLANGVTVTQAIGEGPDTITFADENGDAVVLIGQFTLDSGDEHEGHEVNGTLSEIDIMKEGAVVATATDLGDLRAGHVVESLAATLNAHGEGVHELHDLLALFSAPDLHVEGGDDDDDIDGDDGDDTIAGGDGNDHISGGSGDDHLHGDQGHDTLHGDQGADTLDGGDDDDVVAGDDGDDTISGGTGDDHMQGDQGSDALRGNAGNDSLNGGIGADLVVGGAGKDVLVGGGGADRFDFNAIAETRVGSANRDVIKDFSHAQHDKIDLSTIDANSHAPGNQAFHFIGSASFHATGGELRFADHVVSGDVNGDGHADFEIVVANVTKLAASDFIL
jgi:Ca2+-binding RTX toxin-like protein